MLYEPFYFEFQFAEKDDAQMLREGPCPSSKLSSRAFCVNARIQRHDIMSFLTSRGLQDARLQEPCDLFKEEIDIKAPSNSSALRKRIN